MQRLGIFRHSITGWFGLGRKKALSRSHLGSCPSATTLHQRAEDVSTQTPADLVEPSFWGRVKQI